MSIRAGAFAFSIKKEKKMKKYDVVAMGELLIDFTENGKSEQGNGFRVMCYPYWQRWEKRPGLSEKWEVTSLEHC